MSAGALDLPVRRRALSIRQPWAELILRGIKTFECRSRPTRVRGLVYIYAALGRPDVEALAAATYELDLEVLLRGQVLGTVEIVGCRAVGPSDSPRCGFPVEGEGVYFGWELANPTRLAETFIPSRHPQPSFFFLD